MRSYTQLTQEQRYQIYWLMKAGHNQSEIAHLINVDKSTISRELRRNRVMIGYRPKQAHQFSLNRRKKAECLIKTSTWTLIETLLRKDWSPEQVSGWLKENYGLQISHEWIYQHILMDKQAGGANGLEVVSSVPYNHIETILGLPIWQWVGVQRLKALTVMRVNELEDLAGCPLLPIAVRLNQFSIYPWNWDRGTDPELNKLGERSGGDPVDLFPIGSGPQGWHYPQHPEPGYRDLVATNINSVSSEPDPNYGFPFQQNLPGVSLRSAVGAGSTYEGNIYWAREQNADGNFGFHR